MRHRSASVSMPTLSVVLAAITITSSAAAFEELPEPFELETGDRVVLLGGTFIERAQRYGWLETALQLRFPNANFTVRNLGWSGDTVFAESRGIFDTPAKGYERMIAQVREIKPTVIILNYGANEAFNGPGHVDTFIDQYEKLVDDLKPTGAEVVVVGPLPIFQLPAPLPDPTKSNAHRKAYSDVLARLADRRSLRFADMMKPEQPSLVEAVRSFFGETLTHDGVSLTDAGNRLIAGKLSSRLFPSSTRPAMTTVPRDFDEDSPFGMYFFTNADLPDPGIEWQSSPDHIRVTLDLSTSGIVGQGQLMVQPQSAIHEGSHDVYVNKVPQGSIMLTRDHISAVSLVEPLRRSIVEKNQMYFHHWRPQNVTYLFLFRKHEQGNNAKEVEELKVIVSRLEERVFDMKRKPGKLTVELVRQNEKSEEQ